MNDYRNYMDSVSVDMALHRKIMSRLTQRTSPVRRSMALSRHASAFVCAALLLISIWAVPRLVPSNVAQPPVVQPNGTVPPVATRPGTLGRQQYALLFNQVQGGYSQSKKHDPGYFTQELSPEDISALSEVHGTALLKDARLKHMPGFQVKVYWMQLQSHVNKGILALQRQFKWPKGLHGLTTSMQVNLRFPMWTAFL